MKLSLLRDKSRDFPSIISPEKYTELEIWHCNYKSFHSLEKFINLRELQIASYPEATFEVIRSLKKLESLLIVHLPHISSLDPLKHLTSLLHLSLSTLPSWDSSRKYTNIMSLTPLSFLPKIKTILLTGITIKDNDIFCLSKCPKLEKLNVGNFFSIEQLTQLKAAKPNLEGLEPYREMPWIPCKKCKAPMLYLKALFKRKFLCKTCNKVQFDEYMHKWNKSLESFSNSTLY